MADLMDDGFFTFPRYVDDLADVPEEWRGCYNPFHHNGKDQFLIDARIWKEVVVPGTRQINEAKALIEATKTKGEAGLAALRKEGKDAAVASSIRQALTRAGAKAGLHAGATALLMNEHKFEVEDADDGGGKVVLADTPFGLQSVDAVVSDFLDSDDGAAFRGKTAAPSDGYFTNLIAGLKQRR